MRRVMKCISIILILSLCLTTNTFALDGMDDKSLQQLEEYNLGPTGVALVETKTDKLKNTLSIVDTTDGFSDNELEQISEVATVDVSTREEDGITVTDYTFKPIEPIQVITRNNGEKESLYHAVTYSNYTQEVGSTSSTKTIGVISLKGEMFYFYYEVESRKPLAKLVRAECTVMYGAENMRNLRLDTSAYGFQYDANANYIGHGAEQSTGTTYAKVSNGLYVQWSNIDYYYLLAGEGLLLTRIEFEYKSGSSWITGGLGIRYDG